MTSSSGTTLQELFKGENRPNMFVKSPKRQTSHLDMLKRCFSQDYKSELEFLGGKLATLCYCGAFLSFGMSEAVIGPTLLELGCQTGKGVNRIAWIVFTQAFSAWFGSLTGGLLAERYNCSRVLVTNVLAISICLAFIPVWSIYYGMLITVGLLGINMGMIDTVANVNLIKIHGREVAPRLQALHFCYGIGALLSPMIVRPFLRDQCDGTVVVHNSTNSTIERNRTILNTTTVYKVSKEPITVQFGYWIIASIQIPIILGLVYLIFKQKRLRETFPVPNEGEIISLGDNDSESTSEAMKDLSQIFKPVSLLPAKRPWITISVRVLLITFLSSSLLFLCEGLKVRPYYFGSCC
ncbi:Hypothetical predicted protein [Paramuricea clavata]|uniref:Uncharacterized protein n=1 Tax=Paramuricea clavata TaxID=317549 RepID=A0A6S7I8I1_PARCT|nr:Hypothetical predicted protein [Paramuricea clavata]